MGNSIRSTVEKRIKKLEHSSNDHSKKDDHKETTSLNLKKYSVIDLLNTNYVKLPVLIGNQKNALLVRGEALMIVGPSGIGKTSTTFYACLMLALGKQFINKDVSKPLKVLVFQAELPMPFVKSRMERMVKGHREGGLEIKCETLNNIEFVTCKTPINLRNEANLADISAIVGEVQPDIVIFDPFLSFYQGDENNNNEVRITLDNVKREVAEKHNCGLILTDHVSKSDSGFGARARGAGAKIDWASAVINLSPYKPLKPVTGDLIQVEITKSRYGWNDGEPIILLRDKDNLSHRVWTDKKMDTKVVASIVKDNGGAVETKTLLRKELKDVYDLGSRRADHLINKALKNGEIVVEKGERKNCNIYQLPTGVVQRGFGDELCDAV